MLCHAHGPQNADTLGISDHVGYPLQSLHGEATGARSVLERERLEALSIFFKVIDPLSEKGSMRKAIVEQVAANGRKPDQIRTWTWVKENIGAPCHLMFSQIGDNQLLTVQLVRSLYTSGNHGMALCRVAADDNHQIGLFDVRDRTGIAAVAHRSEQAGGRRSLAVPRAVVHVVRADHGPSQLPHQVAFLVGAFGRADKAEGVRAILLFDLRKARRYKVQRLIPAGLTEAIALADQRRGESVLAVGEVPRELALDAGGNAVRRAICRLDLQNVAIFRPDIEAAAHTAICAHRFGAADARFTHLCFDFRDLENRRIAGFRLDAFDDVDHAIDRRF